MIQKINRNQAIANVPPLTLIYRNEKENLMNAREEDLQDLDRTQEIYEDIRYRIINGMLVSILLVGTVRTGKSTLGLHLMDYANEIIEEKYKKKIERYNSICSDELEFNRCFLSGKYKNQCMVIDEHNQLMASGENSTTEKNLLIFNQEVMAINGLHKISICPNINNNYFMISSNYVLEVCGWNKEKKTTLAKVYFIDANSYGTTNRLPLGYCNFNVGNVLITDWYRKYQIKKTKRIELLEMYSMPDIRTAEQSKVILRVYEKLIPMAKGIMKIPERLVDTTLKGVLQEDKIVYSLLSKEMAVRPIVVLVGLRNDIEKLRGELVKKITPEKRQNILEMIKICEEQLENSLNIERRNVKVLEEYQNIQ